MKHAAVEEPGGVTFVVVGVIIIAGLNLLRLVETATNWTFWSETLPVSPLYLAASGLVWCLVWLLAGVANLRSYARAARITLLAGWAYSLYFWLDRLLVQTGAGRENIPFLAVLNLVLLAWLHWYYRRAGWGISRQRT